MVPGLIYAPKPCIIQPDMLCIQPNVTGIGIALVHHRKRAALGAHSLCAEFTPNWRCRAFRSAGWSHPKRTCVVHSFERISVTDLESPSDAARMLRKLWKVPAGPIHNRVLLIEQAGGLILVRDLGTRDLDAVSNWDGEEAPLFVLNDHAPSDRFRLQASPTSSGTSSCILWPVRPLYRNGRPTSSQVSS